MPAMAAACKEGNRGSKLAGSCLGLLTTFVDSSKDIPNHRLTEFMVRLVRSLGERDYLWVAALLLARKERKGERGAIEMLINFAPSEGLEALLRLMVNTRQDYSMFEHPSSCFGFQARLCAAAQDVWCRWGKEGE